MAERVVSAIHMKHRCNIKNNNKWNKINMCRSSSSRNVLYLRHHNQPKMQQNLMLLIQKAIYVVQHQTKALLLHDHTVRVMITVYEINIYVIWFRCCRMKLLWVEPHYKISVSKLFSQIHMWTMMVTPKMIAMRLILIKIVTTADR